MFLGFPQKPAKQEYHLEKKTDPNSHPAWQLGQHSCPASRPRHVDVCSVVQKPLQIPEHTFKIGQQHRIPFFLPVIQNSVVRCCICCHPSTGEFAWFFTHAKCRTEMHPFQLGKRMVEPPNGSSAIQVSAACPSRPPGEWPSLLKKGAVRGAVFGKPQRRKRSSDWT